MNPFYLNKALMLCGLRLLMQVLSTFIVAFCFVFTLLSLGLVFEGSTIPVLTQGISPVDQANVLRAIFSITTSLAVFYTTFKLILLAPRHDASAIP